MGYLKTVVVYPAKSPLKLCQVVNNRENLYSVLLSKIIVNNTQNIKINSRSNEYLEKLSQKQKKV